MLPPIRRENHLRPFRFWFNGGLQDGLHYQNELFYRSKTVNGSFRARLYHLACRLTEQGAEVLVTTDENRYSLWISLRNQKLALMGFQQHLQLPAAEQLLTQDRPHLGGLDNG